MEATMDDATNRTEDTRIVRFTQGAKGRHRVGAPAEVIESATYKKIAYAQNDKEHRTNGPSEFLIYKPTGAVLAEQWRTKGQVLDRKDLPFATERNREGEITKQFFYGRLATQGPWHTDPDYLSIPDKPRAAESETETHLRGTAQIIDGRFHASTHGAVLHRDGNLPARTYRSSYLTRQEFLLDGKAGRTDGGPTTINFGRSSVEQQWEVAFPINEYGLKEARLHRDDGPAKISLKEDGTIQEEWYREGKLYTPTGHDLMKWARLKAEQGGPLWVPPEQRHPDGPNGPTQVLIHPDTGVRFYEATHDILGRLDRADGPAQIIRDQRTGQTLLEGYHKEGLSHREGGPSLTVFDPKTGAVAGRYWHLEGTLTNPDGAAVIKSTRHGTATYTGFAENGEILHAKVIDHETGVAVIELDRRNNGTKAPTKIARSDDGTIKEQEWRDTQDRPHRDGAPAIVKGSDGWLQDPEQKWLRQGQPYQPTPEDNIRWASLQREQGGIFHQENAQPERTGGVKAAALAAAEAAAKPKPKTADRGNER
jgi:hypothetical protein